MQNKIENSFLQSIKGKVIIASFLACFTLLLAYCISRIAFKQMLSAVEKIAAPNDKLRLVNELSHGVTGLDQPQRIKTLSNTASYYRSFNETKKLILTVDTLKALYTGDSTQIRRIKSLKKLLIDRDRLFINYLKVREGLVNNKTLANQVKELNSLVNKSSARLTDTTGITTQKSTSIITIVPNDLEDTVEDKRGFFSKLFGKKKPVHIPQKNSYKVVNEELKVKRNSLANGREDSLIKGMGRTMRELEKTQLRKSVLFVNKEASLTKANNKIIQQILTILKQVQAEAVAETELNNSGAKNVVNTSISRISTVMLVFFLFTIVLVYFILTDITRINRYKKELELARDEAEYHGQAKQRFLSNMSHEIRTPLQSIIGYAELIQQQEHPQKKDVKAIYQSAEHLMQIVNEVLDYNRIISGAFTFSCQVFNMVEVLEEVISVLDFQASKKGITLISNFKNSNIQYMEGDAFRLKQILYNLLGNAIKFTNAGEVRLNVSCIEQNEHLQYTFIVSDTGIGLSDNDIKRIFNEFEQVQEPGLNILTGTGLGLTISKALIESQGGSIHVKSKLGEGSSFTFFITYKRSITETPVVKPIKRTDIVASNVQDKVWIIDDDKFILDLCSSIFDSNNISHQCFNSPDEILNTPFDNTVKYIFLDIRMPKMSGTELCRILRTRVGVDVLIYALTAQVLPNERELVLSQGFDGLLMKPFRTQDLLTLITSVSANIDSFLNTELDISMLEKLTFGDKNQLNKILKRFTQDCIDDISDLRFSIENHDFEKVVLLVHRIAGRTGQIGAGALAAEFRKAEIELRQDEDRQLNNTDIILLLTAKLQNFIKQISKIYLSNEIAEVTE